MSIVTLGTHIFNGPDDNVDVPLSGRLALGFNQNNELSVKDSDNNVWTIGSSVNMINKLVSITLLELELSSFTELTNSILSTYINTLEISALNNENYYFEVSDSLSNKKLFIRKHNSSGLVFVTQSDLINIVDIVPTPSLQNVASIGNTIDVPDINQAKAILVTVGGIGTVNNPDGFVVINNGRETEAGVGLLGSFVAYLRNKDNVGFYSLMQGTGGTGFKVFVSESSDQSGLGYLLQDSDGNNLFSIDELGNLNATKLSITGGTSNEYLMADGSVSSGGGSATPIPITKTEIDILISSNSLVAGTLYEITGVHPTLYNDGTNSGTTIYLQAMTNNKLATQGNGIFYNPKYDKNISGFGIWDNKNSWIATPQELIESTIFASTGSGTYTLAMDSLGNIYTTNSNSNNISKITPDGTSTIFASTGLLPVGISIDKFDNIFVTNMSSHNISKITPDGTSTIFASTGLAPSGIVFDEFNNIYVSNANSNNISKITPDGTSTIFASTGLNPISIGMDSLGNIYTVNRNSGNISKITPDGTSTIFGTTGINSIGIAIDTFDNVYTVNQDDKNISKITPDGTSTIFGATSNSTTFGLVIDIENNLYTVNQDDKNIIKITPDGTSTIFGTTQNGSNSLIVDSQKTIYVANSTSSNVSKITQTLTQFNSNELITANNGATGQLFQTLDWNTFIAITGDWSSVTSITGDVTGAIASVTDIVLQSYTIDGKAIWGGYSWTNLTGNVGQSIDVLNLDPTDWSKDTYDEVNYNQVLDLIEYDIENDWISRRYEAQSGNDVTVTFFDYLYISQHYCSISVFMFGNEFDGRVGVGNNLVNHAYNENINFTGSFQHNLTFSLYASQQTLLFIGNSHQENLTFGQNSYQTNLIFGQNSYQNNLTFGNSSYQNNLTFGQDSNQQNLIFGQNSIQNNLVFSLNSFQNNLIFGNSSYQNNLTFGQNSYQSSIIFGNIAHQSNLTFGQYSYQEDITFGQYSYQENIEFGQNAYQLNLTFGQYSHQSDLIFGENSNQYGLIFQIDSFQVNINFNTAASQNGLSFQNYSSQYDIVFGKNAYQSDIVFGSHSYQGVLTFEENARQHALSFGQNAFQESLIFGKNAYQSSLTFEQDSFQYGLVFEQDSRQEQLMFGQNAFQQFLILRQNAFQYKLVLGQNCGQDVLTLEVGSSQTNLVFESDASQTNLIIPAAKSQQKITFETGTGIVLVDYSLATLIYDSFPKTIYKRPDGTNQLRYYNNDNVLVFADINE